MRVFITLAVLIYCYVLVLLDEKITNIMSASISQWLDTEHGSKGYIGWIVLAVVIVTLFLSVERIDRIRARKRKGRLIEAIKKTGITAKKTKNVDLGDVQHHASITVEKVEYHVQIRVSTQAGKEIRVVNENFLSWDDMVKFIETQSIFRLSDFNAKTKVINKS